MGVLEFLRQFCCFRPAYLEEKPSHLASLTTTTTNEPSLPACSSRAIRSEAAYRRHLADVTQVTRLNPKEGFQTLARHFASEYEIGGSWWRDYEKREPLPPHCRWS